MNTPSITPSHTATPSDVPHAAPAAQEPTQVEHAPSAAEHAPVEHAPAAPEAAPARDAAPATADTPRGLLKQFQEQFAAFRDCLPLSIGIDKQILAQLPELNRKLMRTALGIHTGSLRYLRVMEKAKLRYDLDGTAGAEVTPVHRDHAKEVLQQRFKKEAERKKAERDAAAVERAAERAAAAEEEASRLRADKLSQLTAKFSRKG